MDLMSELHRMDKPEVLQFVKNCQDPKSGGFAPTLHHDPHLLYTLSAIQVTTVSMTTQTCLVVVVFRCWLPMRVWRWLMWRVW